MKNLRYNFKAVSKDELEMMIERYFDCELSEEEEILLRNNLAHCKYKSKSIDEALATMGFLAEGAKHYNSRIVRLRVRRTWKIVSAAAVIAVAGTIGIKLASSNNGTCVAYVNGVKVTDSEMVMSMVKGDLNEVNTASKSVDDNMQQQLSSVGDAIDVEF